MRTVDPPLAKKGKGETSLAQLPYVESGMRSIKIPYVSIHSNGSFIDCNISKICRSATLKRAILPQIVVLHRLFLRDYKVSRVRFDL